MRLTLLLTAVVVFPLAACKQDLPGTSDQVSDKGSTVAVWTIAPGNEPNPTDRKLRLSVTQVACNGGRTNPVRAVDSASADESITITVTVAPVTGAATCPLGKPRSYEYDLGEPVGRRRLVDGACQKTAARTTSWCDPDGVRFDPKAAEPAGPFEVRGRLLLVGGPAGTEPRASHGGVVRFTGPVTRTVPVTRRGGDFRAVLPRGVYTIVGRSPGFLDGRWACSAPELRLARKAAYVDVTCALR